MGKILAIDKRTNTAFIAYGILFLLAISVLYVRASFFLNADIEYVVTMVPDDACYFFKIARNVVEGKGLSFDGINLTNGFQPLWLYTLLPLAWIMKDVSAELFFRAALVYQLMFLVFAGFLLFYGLAKLTNRNTALVSTAIFFLFSRYFFSNGMETGVLLLSLSALLAFAAHYQVFFASNRLWVPFMFGLLLGLVFLARLDMMFLVIVIYAFLLLRLLFLRKSRDVLFEMFYSVLLSAFGLVVVVLPYFIYNAMVFGDFMPMSGKLKNSFPEVVRPDFVGKFTVRNLVAVAFSVVFLVTSVFLKQKLRAFSQQQKYLFSTAIIGAATVLMLYLNTALFIKWGVFYWHFSFYFYMIPVIIATWGSLIRFGDAESKFSVSRFVAIGFALIILGHIFTSAQQQYSRRSEWHAQAYRAALWVRQNTRPDEVFALSDAGMFGYFSQRAVINLDGLVNNMDYQEAIKNKKIKEYLLANKVRYLVVHSFKIYHGHHNSVATTGDYDYLDLKYLSHYHDTWSDPIRVYRVDEVYRSAPYLDGNYRTVFLIWRLRHDHHRGKAW